MPTAREGERWFLELDHERLDGTSVRLRAPLGAGEAPAAVAMRAAADDTPLIPLELDPLTVVDDRRFAARLAVQPNLPERLKRELPRLYGK
jgi:hypothetical protein